MPRETLIFQCEMVGQDGRVRRRMIQAFTSEEAAESFCRKLSCSADDWVGFEDQDPVEVKVDGRVYSVTPIKRFDFEAEEVEE